MSTSLAPVTVFEHALHAGRARLDPVGAGSGVDLPIASWTGLAQAADETLVSRCHGPTLDLGCGPGRITAALAGRGIAALGVDVSARAVALTRARGAAALHRDVFTLTAGQGRWAHVLLADGNVGIGGDPVRLLWHVRELLDPSGSVLLDVDPPGGGLRTARVRLVVEDRTSTDFAWSWLAVDALGPVAAAAGLGVADVWQVGERWQAELVVSGEWTR